MERFAGKVAILTGASSGIGAAIVEALVKHGVLVVGLARRVGKLDELAKNLSGPGSLYAVKCDVSKEAEILRVFKWITDDIGPVNILVNCAGVVKQGFLTDGSTDDWKQTLDVNILAVCICTREAFKIMQAHNIDGHIIHINSVTGHDVPKMPVPMLNVYPGSKFAVTALTESLRQELNYLKSKIKITSVSPGLVGVTDLFDNWEENMKQALGTMPSLLPSDVAQGVIYALSTGPNVQVHDLIIRPIGEFV